MASKNLLKKYVHVHLEAGYLINFPKYRYINNQGQIVSIVSKDDDGTPNAYEVLWYECGFGTPAHSTIVLKEQMLFENWSFYDDHDLWVSKMDECFALQSKNYDMLRELERRASGTL